MATEIESETGARYGERFGWLDRSLALTCAGSLVVAVLAGLVQVSYGTFSMSVLQAWSAVLDPLVWTNPGVLVSFVFGDGLAESLGLATEVDLPKETLIVWNTRLPRVLVAAFVGFNLAVSGAIFQAVTRNELASPFILGVSSGAGFAVLVTLVLVPTFAAFLPLTAALGGTLAFAIVYAIAWKGGTSPVRLVLAGVIVGTVLNSLQTALFFFAGDIGTVQAAIAWTTGSLTGVDWEQE